MVSAGETSRCGRYQTESYTVNSEVVVMGFTVLYLQRVLVLKYEFSVCVGSLETGMDQN